jgi:hypothetical protein
MSKMDDTAWAVSNNYFTTSAGKIVTQWPFSALDYGALLKTLGPVSERVRRRGEAVEDVSVDEDALRDAEGEEPLRYERW